jgi:hypothetical protein
LSGPIFQHELMFFTLGAGAGINLVEVTNRAGMAELADAADSKSSKTASKTYSNHSK